MPWLFRKRLLILVPLIELSLGMEGTPQSYAVPRRFLQGSNQRLIPINCAGHITQMVPPTGEALLNYPDAKERERVGKSRFETWIKFLKRTNAYDVAPFADNLDKGVLKYLRSFGGLEIYPVSLEYRKENPHAAKYPALFAPGSPNDDGPPKLALNPFHYAEDPHFTFAQAIWKLWVLRNLFT